MSFLAAVVQELPETSMHMIPTLIPEAVLGTKEPSEKARTAAFNLIVTMGHKMSAGGVVRRDKVDGMDEDGATEGTLAARVFWRVEYLSSLQWKRRPRSI
jgi:ribosomal RNA-processing protein 12